MTNRPSLDHLPRFGEFRIDIEEGMLFLDGKVVPLRPKVFAALKVLYQHLNKTVEYEQIGKLGWKLEKVEKHNVQTTIGEAARKLGEKHGARIENVPQKGYRLVTDEYSVLEARDRTASDPQFQIGREIDVVSAPRTEAAVVFDGIALNKASELMYDTEATVAEREASGFTYVRSLEDFALGIVFGGRVLSGEVREIAKGVEPVKDLRGEFGESRIQQFTAEFTLKPPDLLDPEQGERMAVEGLLQQLGEALARNPNPWREHAIREIRGIGHHASLTVAQEDPGAYDFEQQFWPDRILQQRVPPEFLDYMIKIARSRVELPQKVHDAALQEYYSRNTLAHILIFRWYQKAAERECGPGKGVLLPHATRASLVPTKSPMPREFEGHVPSTIWRLKRFVMPRIILDILDRSLDREDFRKWLLEYTHMSIYREHRELFATIVASLGENRLQEADQAVAALEKLCRGAAPDNVCCCQFSTQSHQNIALPLATRQAPIMSEYFAALERVFPELKLAKSRPYDDGLGS